jgi:hypothetical protein
MTQVVKVDFKGPKSIGLLVALDALSTAAQEVINLTTRIRRFVEAEPHSLAEADQRIAELQALKPPEQDLTGLAAQIEDGLRRATSEQVQEQLTLLLGASRCDYRSAGYLIDLPAGRDWQLLFSVKGLVILAVPLRYVPSGPPFQRAASM